MGYGFLHRGPAAGRRRARRHARRHSGRDVELHGLGQRLDRRRRGRPAAAHLSRWPWPARSLLVSLTYVLPIAAVAMTGLPADRWSTGGWADVARATGRQFGYGRGSRARDHDRGNDRRGGDAQRADDGAIAPSGGAGRGRLPAQSPRAADPRHRRSVGRDLGVRHRVGALPELQLRQAHHARRAAHRTQHRAAVRGAGRAAHSRAPAAAAIPRAGRTRRRDRDRHSARRPAACSQSSATKPSPSARSMRWSLAPY